MPNPRVPAVGGAMPAAIKALHPFGMPKGMDPRVWRQSVAKRVNDLLDRAAALVEALDLMETDCDLEDTADDEPSLGWTERGGQSYFTATAPNPCPGAIDDLEQDNCDDEDSHDAEPAGDGEVIMWPDDLQSQEVLVTL